jgi:alanine racemase
MAVVKADAYGHGLSEIAHAVVSAGADVLGVARINEAIQVRKAGLDVPVLIFGHTPPEQAGALIDHDLTQTFWSYQTARLLSDVAQSMNRKIKAHLKVDTGMGRLGIVPCNPGLFSEKLEISEHAVEEAEAIKRLPGIDLEGVYTHFATADAEDKTFALHQFEIFNQFIAHLKNRGTEFEVRHAANSAATIDMPETHLDMVRAGISVYGYYPSGTVDLTKINLLPAMTLKARIIHLKDVDAGFAVSYGATEKTLKPTQIATVSIGYADGYNRLLSSKGKMLIHKRLAPVIGRICMDQTMLDVGGIPGAAVGDEVVVFGFYDNLSVDADNIAKDIDTISYEVLAGVSDRVPRVYIR